MVRSVFSFLHESGILHQDTRITMVGMCAEDDYTQLSSTEVGPDSANTGSNDRKIMPAKQNRFFFIIDLPI